MRGSNVQRRAAARPAFAVLFLPLLLVIPGGLHGTIVPAAPTIPGVTVPALPHFTGSLTAGSKLGTHLASPFYEVVLDDDQLGVKGLVQLGVYLNSTPLSLFRFGGQGEGYDPTLQINYLPPASGSGTYNATSQQLWNLTWFKSWCDSRTPHCSWLSYLPAEENSTAAAIHYAKWYHSVLGLAPTYWEFGNEPSQWDHYGKNMTTWSTADASQPTALDYATMVHDYITAVAALYPHDKFVGLEAACACNRELAAETMALDGGLIAAMAYHSYPTISNSSTVLSSFYGLLASPANVTNSSAHFRAGILAGCPTCSIPVELGEYQAGPVNNFSPFVSAYPGAPFLAGSLIEAIQANLSSFAVFNSNSLFNLTSGTATYEGLFYQSILANMTMGTDYGVTVRGTGISGVEALLIKNGSREALLVVDANANTGLALTIGSTVFAIGGAGSEWLWSSTGAFSHLTYPHLPASYTVGSQGILLLRNY